MPGATPLYGLPFPELDEPPHGPELAQLLAEAVEDAIAAEAAARAAAIAAIPGAPWQVIGEGAITAATSFTIAGIPQTYKDLRLRLKIGSQNASYTDYVRARCAGDTGGNYDYGWLYGFNAGPAWATGDNETSTVLCHVPGNSGHVVSFGTCEIVVADYRAAHYRTLLARFGFTTGLNGSDQKLVGDAVGSWTNSVADALTSITLFLNSGASFRAGSRYVLEGRL